MCAYTEIERANQFFLNIKHRIKNQPILIIFYESRNQNLH